MQHHGNTYLFGLNAIVTRTSRQQGPLFSSRSRAKVRARADPLHSGEPRSTVEQPPTPPQTKLLPPPPPEPASAKRRARTADRNRAVQGPAPRRRSQPEALSLPGRSNRERPATRWAARGEESPRDATGLCPRQFARSPEKARIARCPATALPGKPPAKSKSPPPRTAREGSGQPLPHTGQAVARG